MRSLIEQIEFKAQNTPQYVLLADEVITNGITCRELDVISGRVYAYLKKIGIGKEDFVLINLARGIMPVIAMVGVLKAGAAFTIVEEGYAPERIDYIRKDCGCKAEINRGTWEEILKCEPLYGHEQTGDHDAAYAVYTSGTTGNPKGVLHEYGNIVQGVIGSFWNGKPIGDNEATSVLVSPMNFVTSIMLMFDLLYNEGRRYYIPSYTTIKNPLLLNKLLIEKRVNSLFLTPSYARMISKNLSPFVKTIVVGSEPANNVYIENVDIYNIYSMSESGFAAAVFKIDKPYATCPIGKPQLDIECKLLDEDGNEVEEGEVGEFCFENKYVRGYINLPEENARAFRDGIYHSGDLARKLSDGSFVLLGRSTDMIKINGNRIEPAEIEAAVKSALGIEWAAAKGFENGKQSYICVYYTENIDIDTEKLRNELLKKLPYYMIPSYYMQIDSVPLRPNGKLDRKALPEPKRRNSDYAEPTNDVERALCSAFANVLELERVGIYDDFYELGGDSLGSIDAILESGLPGLEASMIFRGRTAAKIAKLYCDEHGTGGESDDEKNAKSMKQAHRLTTEQLHMVDYQLYTPMSTMYNLFVMLKHKKGTVETSKLVNAVESAIRNHPALLTRFSFNEDGEIVQTYDPSLMPEIRVEKISEFDLKILKDTLVQPFKIINSRLFRNRIFETEKAVYVFFDLHHTIFDGTSFKVLRNDIAQAYAGIPLSTDYYYLGLKKREEAVLTPFYEESRKYFEECYDGDDWVTFPPVDHMTRENEFGHLQCEQKIDTAELSAFEKRCRISRNEFFIAVSALAISMYSNSPNIKMSWIYNGRDNALMMNTVGLLFRDLPVAFRFDKSQKISDIFADTHEQVQNAIKHSCYPYVENNIQIAEGDFTSVLYQRDIRETGKLGERKIENVELKQNRAASQNILDIEILDDSDGLRVLLEYTSSRYKQSSMERFKDLLVRIASSLVHSDSAGDITIGELCEEIRKNNF